MRLLNDQELARVSGGDHDAAGCSALGGDMAGIAYGMVTDNPAQVGINTAAAALDAGACFGGSSDSDSGGVCGANSGYGGYGGAGSGCGDGGGDGGGD